MQKKDRRARLDALQTEERTVIFYEAPHKLRNTLDDLAAAFGPDRSITLCRELTKLHEEVTKTTIGEAAAYYKENAPRGEYVLVMAGGTAAPHPAAALTLEDLTAKARQLMESGMGTSAAAKAAAQGSPYSKSDVYRQLMNTREE